MSAPKLGSGMGLSVKVALSEAAHPFASVTVTVYTPAKEAAVVCFAAVPNQLHT